MSENPLISILTPSYNHEKFVAYFIESLIAQSYKNWELIIVDDCSSDGNVKEIRKFTDSRIHLFVQDFNQGPGAALNKAFFNSHGEIIVDMASDDMLYPDYFEYIVKTFAENPAVGVMYSSLDVMDENNRVYKTWRLNPSDNRLTLLQRLFYGHNCLFSPGMASLRYFYQNLIPMNEALVQHQDYQWHIQLLSYTDCHISYRPYVMYRQPRKKMNNLSKHSLSEQNRLRLEIDSLMDSFLAITDLKLIKQITKSEYCSLLTDECTDFIWGMAALKTECLEKKQWGYKVISKVYFDYAMRKKINNLIGLKFSDYLEIANEKYYNDESFFVRALRFVLGKFISIK